MPLTPFELSVIKHDVGLLLEAFKESQPKPAPWKLPRALPGFRPLNDGEEWHRQDFTQDMLPEGWRPLLLGEQFCEGDQAVGKTGKHYISLPEGHSMLRKTCADFPDSVEFYRTRRPLPDPERERFSEWWHRCAFDTSGADMSIAWSAWQAARSA